MRIFPCYNFPNNNAKTENIRFRRILSFGQAFLFKMSEKRFNELFTGLIHLTGPTSLLVVLLSCSTFLTRAKPKSVTFTSKLAFKRIFLAAKSLYISEKQKEKKTDELCFQSEGDELPLQLLTKYDVVEESQSENRCELKNTKSRSMFILKRCRFTRKTSQNSVTMQSGWRVIPRSKTMFGSVISDEIRVCFITRTKVFQ